MNRNKPQNSSKAKLACVNIKITGVVQGVGFRPFVYSLAQKNNLGGWVRNTSGGVEIEVSGTIKQVDKFISQLQTDLPPLARIDKFAAVEKNLKKWDDFKIYPSLAKAGDFIPISPDVAICDDCKRELFTPTDRRYRYPFINCTNCGPRFTIIKDIPYDRPKTTMHSFEMCPECQREYNDPLDRRFHAQPVACSLCGPHVRFINKLNKVWKEEDAIQAARKSLKEGEIIAIKGLGGYHLACDASNSSAVKKLRSRKQRSDKPFAMMAYDISTIRRHCMVSTDEEMLLNSRQAPVVLLDKLEDSTISSYVSPNQLKWAFMVPYTPLHLLLLEPAENYPEIFVMTSGNISEEPIAYVDEDALSRLSNLADGYLVHDRPIYIRTDDSVAKFTNKSLYILRRARGYTPDSLNFPFKTKPILATGSELKNTFCLTRDTYAFISHHIGDLENYETFRSYEESVEHFQYIFKITPELISCDMHPNYLSTRFGEYLSAKLSLPLLKVQHHHAHFASCLAENGWPNNEKAIGIILDGTGLGIDNTIWGGEVLFGNYDGFERKFHLEYMPLPGGDAAIKNPARIALAYLWQNNIEWSQELIPVAQICEEERQVLKLQLAQSLNTIQTSSMGRLFDSVSSLIGVCQVSTYEGQPAIELESVCDPAENQFYDLEIDQEDIKIGSMLEAVMADWYRGVSYKKIASRFHNSIVEMIVQVCQMISAKTGCKVVVLSGGVWQNDYLLSRTVNRLKALNYKVLIHKAIPTNDGGIALGQAAVAAAWCLSH